MATESAACAPRRLHSQKEIDEFASSPTGGLKILTYLQQLGQAFHGYTDLRIDEIKTPYLRALRDVIMAVREMADEISPFSSNECEQRYGNPAFRIFLRRVEESAKKLVSEHARLNNFDLPIETEREIAVYLKQSFGNGTRIDYGSGHELNFIAATLVANEAATRLSGRARPRTSQEMTIEPEAAIETILGVYLPYLELARYLQKRYRLEPAGSRGAWGLDDFQFIGFLLGSYQIDDSNYAMPKPSESAEKTAVMLLKTKFLYFNMISHIMQTKGEFAPFHLISPMLFDISRVSSWGKIASGFEKMFQNEILRAYPIMQHFPLDGSTFL